MHYFFIYDRIFSRFINAGKPVTLLEIGVQNGGSLEIWEKYLPKNSEIHGIDIDEKCAKLQFSDNIHFHLGSAADSDFMNKTFKDIQFDIILDDGSHICKDVIKTFVDMFPKLKWGGMYVVEDMHTAYWKEYGGDFRKRGSSIEYFKNFIDVLNFDYIRIKKHNISKRFFRKRFLEFNAMISEVSFFDSVCKIDKLYQPKNTPYHTCYAGSTEPVVSISKSINHVNKEIKMLEIRDYFNRLNPNEQNAEILEIIDYFKKHDFSVFPYEFPEKYRINDIHVLYDVSCSMRFVFHNGKKMYFPQRWNIEAVQRYYTGLCIEQDEDSPHRYETKEFSVKDGDVIADIGAAEGIWALNYAEKAEKIYLFECENYWIEALRKTFEPWKEKVVIVNKYVSNKTDDTQVSLDEFFNKKRINVIKADIEGAELELLEGSKELLSKSNNLKLLLCAYHRHDDDKNLKTVLENAGFTTEYSKRYMLFIHDEQLHKPYIRRGIIRAKK